ncbi:MAG: hypothetical protein Q7Q71_05190 [Verrucomicrobiota bacterium JB023]|nr:hypothetical protein [Verrucomicrobiota bacterium JB023]
MPHGKAFLCAVTDWYLRRILWWSLSSTMETRLCLEALKKPFSAADRGCQFTSEDMFTAV